MITCMNCEHGHDCPHTGDVDDLLHALAFVWDEMPKNKGSFTSFSKRFRAKDADAFRKLADIIRDIYGIKIDFELGYDKFAEPAIGVKNCEKYKEIDMVSMKNDDIDIEITEDDVKTPLEELTINNRAGVQIHDMADYTGVFFAIERTIMEYWNLYPGITDRDVLSALSSLIKDFDNQEEETLASEISKGTKAMLIQMNRADCIEHTIGEIFSCIKFLKGIVKNHKSPDKIGYLKWNRAFFEGRMPETPEEIAKYISEEEM